MSGLSTRRRPWRWLDEEEIERLHHRLRGALRRARASRTGVVVSVSVQARQQADPAAIVLASRRPGEHWF